jgi:hypothetical protein
MELILLSYLALAHADGDPEREIWLRRARHHRRQHDISSIGSAPGGAVSASSNSKTKSQMRKRTDYQEASSHAPAFPCSRSSDLKMQEIPSPSGSDEFIPIFLSEKELERHGIEDLKGKFTGEGVKGEKITVKQCDYEDLWKEGQRDAKTLAAWDRIGVTDSFRWIASASALISILSSMLYSDSNSSSKATQGISYLDRCVEVRGHAIDTSISQEPGCSKCTVGGYRNQIRSFVKVCL